MHLHPDPHRIHADINFSHLNLGFSRSRNGGRIRILLPSLHPVEFSLLLPIVGQTYKLLQKFNYYFKKLFKKTIN